MVGAGRSRLLVDIGYPGTMGLMLAGLARKDVPLGEIRYALATHCHLDHAGLAQEMTLAGVPLLALDDGSVFTGGLAPPRLATEDQAALVKASWNLPRDRGATRVYPAHGSIRP